VIDESECFIDATFASAKGGGDVIGSTKCGKGVKIMAIVDRNGLPLSVSTHAANQYEMKLVQLSFDFYMIETKPESLIGAKRKAAMHWLMNCIGKELKWSHRTSTTVLRRRHRMSVDCGDISVVGLLNFFSWAQWQRRFLIRWEYYAKNLLGLV
jgi:hypothetical protein